MRRSGKIIRVLIVDDSQLARKILIDILSSDPDLRVIGEAKDGLEAVDKANSLKPDIVTMDIDMPVLNGLEAIERIMGQCPMPILAVTALSGVRMAFKAVTKGALDILDKSDITLDDGATLIRKIKILAGVDVAVHHISMLKKGKIKTPEPAKIMTLQKQDSQFRSIVAIAASTGGPQAISAILSQLPASFPTPIVIAQHVAAGFTEGITEWLNTCTALTVMPAIDGDRIMPGHVYLNPSEFSMRINSQGLICLSKETSNQMYHPSCDTLLCSVAEAFGKNSVGVILSGMGSDGVSGINSIKTVGGATLAQDEQSSVVFGMNGIAIKQGAVENVLSLNEIPGVLIRLVGLNNGELK
ncbi:chemotaxis-specific protein-glutamate methyltransferase CheB [Desulforegula conservatrix]|uniref:chemotaxis-specific protein-glutamate methyltransferase CheB n=1 Tax=Desulforegula conservatrix TaxID=153026 RepID=UPI000408FC0B|nr:chemotaxis-specific protein-glutamate methyltransferase CheB [Desulforegula conservatrix]